MIDRNKAIFSQFKDHNHIDRFSWDREVLIEEITVEDLS